MIAEWEVWGRLIQDGSDAAILHVKLGIHDDEQVDVQSAGGFGLLADLNGNTFAGVLYATPCAVELVVVRGPEVQPQGVLGCQVLGERHIRQSKIFRDRTYRGVPPGAACMKLSGLVPLLVRAKPLDVQLIRDVLDGNLDLRDFRIVEGLGVALEGSRGVLTEQQDSLHGAGRDIEIYIPERLALVANDLAVPQYAVVQDRQAAGVLVADHPGVGHLVVLEANVFGRVAAITIGHYDSTVVVKCELVLESVPLGPPGRMACETRAARNRGE